MKSKRRPAAKTHMIHNGILMKDEMTIIATVVPRRDTAAMKIGLSLIADVSEDDSIGSLSFFLKIKYIIAVLLTKANREGSHIIKK